MKKVVTAIAAWALAASATALAADATPLMQGGDPEAGESMSRTCAGCHGPDGNSPQGQWPNIAGQHAGYLFDQLRSFKAGEARSNPQMAGIVSGLSEDDMRNLAAFYSTQPRRIMGAADADLVERGRRIYLGGIPDKGVTACAACHGPQGKGNPAARYPAVGGQWSQYLVQQLEQFRTGARANDPNAMMRSLAEDMSDHEIRAVAEYMAGLN